MSEAPSPYEIELLSIAEAIRAQPGSVLDLETPGLASVLAMQSLCHAVDEAMDGRCTSIAMRVAGARISVHYDCGMPLKPDADYPDWSVAEMFLSVPMACSSRKKYIEVGSRFCRIGLAVLNPLCTQMRVEIVDEGQQAHLRFERGVQCSPCLAEPTDRSDGTWMAFALDPQVLADTSLREDVLREAFADLARQFPALRLTLDFSA